MESPVSQQFIEEQLLLIPESLQEAVVSQSWEDIATKLATQYNLSDEERVQLSSEILMVLLALESPRDFLKNVQNQIHRGPEILTNITQKVNENIFAPVKDILEALDEDGKNNGGVEATASDATGDSESPIKADALNPREQILKEIEAPELLKELPSAGNAEDEKGGVSTSNPINIKTPAPSVNIGNNQRLTPNQTPTTNNRPSTPATQPTSTRPLTPNDEDNGLFVANKMTVPTSSSQPSYKGSDPYRELVN